MGHRFLAVVSCMALGTASVAQEVFVDTFEDDANVGGWVFQGDGSDLEGIVEPGGNPGAFLSDISNTVAPFVRSSARQSPFTGDFRSRGVSEVRVDLRVIDVNFVETGTSSIMLLMRGSEDIVDIPDWWTETWGAYVLGPKIPKVAQGWATHAFDIPSDSPELPDGWGMWVGPNVDEIPDWNTLIEDVHEVRFGFACLDELLPFQVWEVGIDNPSIVSVCSADFNADGSLDVLDFVAFQNAFVASDASADFNGDGALNVLDFVAFQNAFVRGC